MHLLKVGEKHFRFEDIIGFDLDQSSHGSGPQTSVDLSGGRLLWFSGEEKAAIDYHLSRPDWWTEMSLRLQSFVVGDRFTDLVEEFRKATGLQGASPEHRTAS